VLRALGLGARRPADLQQSKLKGMAAGYGPDCLLARRSKSAAKNFRSLRWHDGKREYLQFPGDSRKYEIIEKSKGSRKKVSTGERRELDLTVEAEIQKPEWHDLFDQDARNRALARLLHYGWTPPAEAA
jgi:hypothetical protein